MLPEMSQDSKQNGVFAPISPYTKVDCTAVLKYEAISYGTGPPATDSGRAR